MFQSIKDYINDNEFKLTIFEDRVYVANYSKIISLEDERISFLTHKGKIVIKGNDLCLNKLLEDEVLISGRVSNIEVDFNE